MPTQLKCVSCLKNAKKPAMFILHGHSFCKKHFNEQLKFEEENRKKLDELHEEEIDTVDVKVSFPKRLFNWFKAP